MKEFYKKNRQIIIWSIIIALSVFYVVYLIRVPSGLQQLINGIELGSIYALIALGYTMVYGIIRLINFAHADIFMLGAYMGLFAFNLFGLPFWMLIILSMVICAVIGVVIEKLAYKPLRFKPRLSALITALGVSLLLENFFRLNPFQFGSVKLEAVSKEGKFLASFPFSPNPKAFPEMIAKVELVKTDFLVITNYTVIYLVVAAILLALLYYIVNHTMIGKQMRAVSFDKNSAALMGINVNRVISYTFVIGPALAGASGILFGMKYGILQSPYLGIWPGWKAFIAAVLGGIGNLPGAVLGSYIMGISEIYATSVNSDLGFGVSFAILILILVLKPTGLLGKLQPEKV
ncbi:MAG: branched-chain amino acid ABC transporter permease [Spirochaetes bacterium]|nr:branched-chain amino acid ABC transporter permease [Spirochaetota bacterium]